MLPDTPNLPLFKNGGRGTKPTYVFMVIIPLLVIELKANRNPSNDFYWRQKSSSLNVVQNNTTSRPIIIHLYRYIDLEVNSNRPTGGIILHNVERARFLPPIKIITFV